ncbi:hypothetical protein [Pantoea septica]|uniref:hypothetical protein n=1 Tax=Pantoea septica TaxID=472695 RepID=UPI003D0652D1
MKLSPVESAHYARLSEIQKERFLWRTEQMTPRERKCQQVALSAQEAAHAAKRDEEHERRLTPERKYQLMEERRLRQVARETAVRPPLPRIIVTKPGVLWMDYQNERRGKFGAVVQD